MRGAPSPRDQQRVCVRAQSARVQGFSVSIAVAMAESQVASQSVPTSPLPAVAAALNTESGGAARGPGLDDAVAAAAGSGEGGAGGSGGVALGAGATSKAWRPGVRKAGEAPDSFVMPPYTEDDKIDDGVLCYMCVAAKMKTPKWFQWDGLFEHIRQKHHVQRAWMAGCYLYEQGMSGVRQQARDRRGGPRFTHHRASMQHVVAMR